MKTVVIEQTGNIALLMKEDPKACERYIVARGYDPLTRQWYGGGTYYKDIADAAEGYKKAVKG